MENKILTSTHCFANSIKDIAKTIGKNLIKNRYNILISASIIIVIKLFISIKNTISYIRELEEVATEHGLDTENLAKVTQEEYDEVMKSAKKYGYEDLKQHCFKSSKGNILINGNSSHKLYAKLTALNSKEFNPDGSKKPEDLICVGSGDQEYKDLKNKGHKIPQFFNAVVVNQKDFKDVIKRKAKNKFGKDADLYQLNSDEFYKFQRDMTRDKNHHIENMQQSLNHEGALDKSKAMNTSGFNCYSIICINEDYYVACKKDALNNYLKPR